MSSAIKAWVKANLSSEVQGWIQYVDGQPELMPGAPADVVSAFVLPDQATLDAGEPAAIEARNADRIEQARDKIRDALHAEFTPNASKAGVYVEKYRQAVAFKADLAINQTAQNYPLIVGDEATARGLTATELANLIVATASAWQDRAAALEAANAQLSVMDATQAEAVVEATIASILQGVGL